MKKYPYVITVCSEKGGVGKTTLATNLAVFLKALDEELPVSIFSFDNHFTIDRMFAFKGQQTSGAVADLFSGTQGRTLLNTGQYGINYIQSSHNLNSERNRLAGPMELAKIIASSEVDGIIIIDTRPDLDTLTQSALYAADRVLIPVKDMPSLENCRNIFSLFEKRGLDRKSLVLIPCLVDERIKFDGPFADQKSLLRAFAINRGYRCHEVHISKSPKVESLNTNPDGKIYPVLTHGRGTDVHGQFATLARDLLREYNETAEPRSLLISEWMSSENERISEAYVARLSGLGHNCPICDRKLLPEITGSSGYYYETSDMRASGFIEENCFLKVLISSIYDLKSDFSADDPALILIKESARDSSFVFRPVRSGDSTQVEFCRIDSGGHPLSRRLVSFRDHAGGIFHDDKCPLHSLMAATLADYGSSFRDGFLLIHPVETTDPEEILKKETYTSFSFLKKRIASLFN